MQYTNQRSVQETRVTICYQLLCSPQIRDLYIKHALQYAINFFAVHKSEICTENTRYNMISISLQSTNKRFVQKTRDTICYQFLSSPQIRDLYRKRALQYAINYFAVH